VLRDLGVESRLAELPEGTQHLLGVVNFLDAGLAAVDAARVTPVLRGVLGEHGYRLLELPADGELDRGRGMNFVAVGPSSVLMPAGCPGIRARLEAERVSVREVGIGEYLKAAGGLGCLTGILAREAPGMPGTAARLPEGG
jgi:N-dimethylarginine dimethylaminohydrolase